MNGPILLESHVGILRTRVGACWPGSRAVFRGVDLHQEFNDADWMALYLYGITGRRFTAQQVRLLHGIWVNTSYPDTRLWNNRVAALAGSVRSSPVLGVAAALAVSEARIYGGGPGLRAIDFFQRAGRAVDAGQSLRAFVEQELAARYIYGYGRPIDAHDERLPWLGGLARSLGLAEGRFFKMAFEVEQTLAELGKPSLKMNYAAMTAALGADMGLSPREFQLFRVPLFLAGMPPCLVEAAEKPEGALFPTPCDGVAYTGPGKRSWRK
ncbi:citrate/2-methylcitrate synthase [Noviherbaspirillum saxi]|uniref:citrate synthase (unknown stereospecificity) n=1 Tax=Noviherbaspirillum saxi TaxID=2320863 RepID=A0A3A3FN46_9BURK|nr:citrate/2-methylcitrate synthase [Noviherbaspirillum saxi]RJF97602.1 citryl-CoA lyase [Noviherbaspirillum saxi]